MQQSQPAAPDANRVLIIDDDVMVRTLLSRIISREGYQVEAAEGGVEGLRVVEERRPAVITLDIDMPGMDGWAVLSAVKSNPRLADIPVVMVSTVDEKSRGIGAGASDYLLKPVDRTRLIAVLRRLTGAAIVVATDQVAPPGQNPNTLKAAGPSRILVVEDDLANRTVLGKILRKEGWVVAEVDSGKRALVAIAETVPDLILLDLGLPELDGFAFLRELRAIPSFSNTPVVVISAKDLTREERSLLRATVFKVFQKGAYSRPELLNDIRSCLSNHGTNQAAPTKG